MRRTDVMEPLRTMGDRRLRAMFRQPEILVLLDRLTVPSLRERARQHGTDAFWDALAREQYQRAAEVALAEAEAIAVHRIQLESAYQTRDATASKEREAAERERQQAERDAAVIETVLNGVLIRPPAIVVEQQSEQTTEPAPLPGVVVPATEEPSLDEAIDAWAAWYAEQGT